MTRPEITPKSVARFVGDFAQGFGLIMAFLLIMFITATWPSDANLPQSTTLGELE